MGKFAKKQHAGGVPLHVGDCRVWAEINYLDSPTDYRECLPAARDMRTNAPWGPSGDSRRSQQRSFYFVFSLTCLFLLAIGLMLYLSDY
jgi:hypothetical protein